MSKFLLTFLLYCSIASAKTLVIAVIDTGIDPRDTPHLCSGGHASFVKVDNVIHNPLKDVIGHGTNVANLIARYAGNGDYCMLSLQFYLPYGVGGFLDNNLSREKRALRYAIDMKVDFINLSGGGPISNNEERRLVEEALDKGITLVVAAGNEGEDIGIERNCYYPACYDSRTVVVGNLSGDSTHHCGDDPFIRSGNSIVYAVPRANSSNFGAPVNRWEIGERCKTHLDDARYDYLSGTSQATAIATGKLVRVRLHR